jgi:hypothetical protein
MNFRDERRDSTQPITPELERLRTIIVERTRKSGTDHIHAYVTLADHDPKTGLSVPHFQLNFEPQWLDQAFKDAWFVVFDRKLRSELLENTEWKRFAWGVWEE